MQAFLFVQTQATSQTKQLCAALCRRCQCKATLTAVHSSVHSLYCNQKQRKKKHRVGKLETKCEDRPVSSLSFCDGTKDDGVRRAASQINPVYSPQACLWEPHVFCAVLSTSMECNMCHGHSRWRLHKTSVEHIHTYTDTHRHTQTHTQTQTQTETHSHTHTHTHTHRHTHTHTKTL
ncbi:unnamed protein product [Gadus morhua 'NCC']